MLKITETERKLVIRDIPLSSWIWGAIFAALFGAFGIFMFISAWETPHRFVGSSGQDPYARGLQILMFVMVIAFVIGMVGLFVSMILTPVHSTTIDLGSQIIFIRRRGIFANNGERYMLSQVKRFEIENANDERGSTYIAVRLANDTLVRLETNADEDSTETINRLNLFVRKT